MSIDLLHEKVRKLKNPSMIDFSVKAECIPAHLLEEEGSFLAAHVRFCRELMAALNGFVPAVRYSFGDFALLGRQVEERSLYQRRCETHGTEQHRA